jgi:hypothetical protein
MEPEIGYDLVPGIKILERFHGIHPDGHTALVQRSAGNDFAQFDSLEHAKCYGWWKFELGTFRKLPD